MVTRRSLRSVPWRSTTSLFFHGTLFYFDTFEVKYTEFKYNTNLNNLFYINIKFDELLSEIDNVLQKKNLN